MNETTIDIDPTDEEVLTTTVSDDALEKAAGTQGGYSLQLTAALTGCC